MQTFKKYADRAQVSRVHWQSTNLGLGVTPLWKGSKQTPPRAAHSVWNAQAGQQLPNVQKSSRRKLENLLVTYPSAWYILSKPNSGFEESVQSQSVITHRWIHRDKKEAVRAEKINASVLGPFHQTNKEPGVHFQILKPKAELSSLGSN